MRQAWVSSTVIVAMLCAMSPVAMADTSGGGLYSDVRADSYAATQIAALTADGYLHGFSDGAFRPDAIMTRAEFAADLRLEMGRAGRAVKVDLPHAGITPEYVATLFVQSLQKSDRLHLVRGESDVQYATQLGLFRGVHEAGREAQTRASAAIMLYNAWLWKQGGLLPLGESPVVIGSQSQVAPNTLVSIHVGLRTSAGRMLPVPPSATVSLNVTQSAGALLLPSTESLMISNPGTYEVTAIVDGVPSKPWTVTATDPPAAVHMIASRTVLSANGKSMAILTATVVDAYGHTETGFDGTATLTPLLHGDAVDPRTGAPITSVTFVRGVARFGVEAGVTGGVSDTVTLDNLATASGQPITSSIDYGWVTMDYAWGSDQPAGVDVSAAHVSILANGQERDAVTATVVNTFGQTVKDFTGVAQLSPLLHGTYVNQTTGGAISSVTFVNGVAHFDILAGTTGGVSDTVTLSGLTDASGTPISTAIGYGSASIDYTWASDQPVSIQVTPSTSTLLANGQSMDAITATVVNDMGQPVSDFSGVAELTPLKYGTYVSPVTDGLISSVTFADGVAHFDVQAGTTGGVSDTVGVADLTDAAGQALTSTLSYGTATIDYTWSSAQPVAVTLTPSTSTLVANGTQTDTITATVMDAFGQPAAGFDGTASLSPLEHGTYVNPETGAAISTVTFVNGVASFAVESGTTGGVSDTVSLVGLTSGTGAAVTAVNNGSATIDYTWPSANSIALVASDRFVSDTQTTADEVQANIPPIASGTFAGAAPVATTFTLNGPGSFALGGAPQTTLTEYIIPGTPTIVPVYSVQGQSGTITVTATAAGITSGQTSISAGAAGAAAELSLTQASETVSAVGTAQEPTLTEGTPFTLYTVGLADASGNPVIPQSTDSLTVSDNTSQVGGDLEYFAVADGQPTGPAWTAAQLDAAISDTTGQAQFAVVNVQAGSGNPSISIVDSLGFRQTVANTFSAGAAAYAMFPLDSVSALNTATTDMEDGQTATYAVQLEDVNGNLISASGQTVDFYFGSKDNTQKVAIDGSSSWTAASPFTAVTNPQGQAVLTVSVPAGVAGAVEIDAALPGSTAVSQETVVLESPSQYATGLTLGVAPGAVNLAWPNGSLTVGQSIAQYLNAAAGGSSGSLYATPIDASGAPTKSGDTLEITTSNPEVLGLTANADWTELNGSTLMLTGSASDALPAVTALAAGTATLTITDISNPSAPRISEVVTVN